MICAFKMNNYVILFFRNEIATYSRDNNKNIKEEIMAAICGCTVITRYNNKTYKIEDIDYSLTPLSTFKQQDSEVSFF